MADTIKIGELASDTDERDAIHIAVAPVIAAEKVYPGQEVGLRGDGCAMVLETNIGIVDPFLKMPVQPGARFWLFLYPQTVTGMRHHWQHPAFATAQVASDEITTEASAEKWIEDFASRINQSYEALMHAADRYVEYGHYEYDNSESYKNCWDEFPEFWKRYEIVRGAKVAEHDGVPFTCSC